MQKNSQMAGLLALALAGVCLADYGQTPYQNQTTFEDQITCQNLTPPQNQTVCIAYEYSQIAGCIASSTNIILSDVYAPSGSSINMASVMNGTTITFAGRTTFGYTNSSGFTPIVFGGCGITITAEPGAIIDGNGQAYWDGLGSNGGKPKPNTFIKASNLIGSSVIENLYILNWPVHLFSITGAKGLTVRNMFLNNAAGDAPNAASGNISAGHNSDGFGIKTSSDVTVKDSIVYNQDDCVAVTSGNNITIDNLYCYGGHGLSIGSVGGKSNNNVTNITFQNSEVVNSTNGPRIKSNYDTTGFISNITYRNIKLTNIATYGIDIQQDYLNGGPTGDPSNGVIIANITFENVTGTALPGAKNYYILCGDGSCSNFTYAHVNITGGVNASLCNFPETGCPA
ncbi:hypothetical protein NHQ30_007919 [Ciborinia camelliae]|nr:hypothetical protein NHQ30_007919 [Ciborinia camelliae]